MFVILQLQERKKNIALQTNTQMSLHPSKYIGSNVYILLNDQRQLTGILTVIDPFGNILLSNVVEESKDKLNHEKTHTREIGLVSVPKDTVVSIKMQRKEWGKIHEPRQVKKDHEVIKNEVLTK